MSGSYRNLAALASGEDSDLAAGSPLVLTDTRTATSRNSMESSRQPR